jgi:hypothetical protein
MAEQGKFGHALYRITRGVQATEIDGLNNSVGAKLKLAAGTQLRVARDRHPWRDGDVQPEHPFFYTVEVDGRRFQVAADELESAILRVLD